MSQTLVLPFDFRRVSLEIVMRFYCSIFAKANLDAAAPGHSSAPIAGNGDLVRAVGGGKVHLEAQAFLMRTDVKCSYAPIDHSVLLAKIAGHFKNKVILNLVPQYPKQQTSKAVEIMTTAISTALSVGQRAG